MKTDGEFLIELGSRMKAIRKSKNVSLEKVSVITGFDPQHIGRVERGLVNAHVLTLKKIADVLKVEVKNFYD